MFLNPLSPAPTRRGSAGRIIAIASLLGLWCLPAHAFISLHFTAWDWIVIGLYFTWPFVLPALLVILALMWRQRPKRRVAFGAVLAVAVIGSAVYLSFRIPEWRSASWATAEWQFWQRLDEVAASGQVDEAVRLLDARGPNAMQEYVDRLPDGPDRLLEMAFSRCADLLRGGLLDIEPLDSAIKQGRARLIQAWLRSPACPRPDGVTREARIAQFVYHLLPYTLDHDEQVQRQLRSGQAAALRVLMAHDPALLAVDVSDFGCARYRGAYSRCTVLSELFDEWHDAGIAALLPLDPQADQHLPAIALQMLQGDMAQTAQAARRDPALFHRLLPALVATMPIEGLRVALKAAPPSEAALLSPQDGETLYQHLSSLFKAARRRDKGEDDWAFLWLIFELFPTRLSELDRNLFDNYPIGTKPRDARVLKMLTTLRAAGMACEKINGLTRWADTSPDAVQWYADVTGCDSAQP